MIQTLFVSVLCELGNRLLSVELFRQFSGDGRIHLLCLPFSW